MRVAGLKITYVKKLIAQALLKAFNNISLETDFFPPEYDTAALDVEDF